MFSDSALLDFIKVEVRALLNRFFTGLEPRRLHMEMKRMRAEETPNGSSISTTESVGASSARCIICWSTSPSLPTSAAITPSGTRMTWMTVTQLILIVLVEVVLFRQCGTRQLQVVFTLVMKLLKNVGKLQDLFILLMKPGL